MTKLFIITTVAVVMTAGCARSPVENTGSGDVPVDIAEPTSPSVDVVPSDVTAPAPSDDFESPGNGFTAGVESCDDGNTDSGDGCSDSCEWETPGQCLVYSELSESTRLASFNDGPLGVANCDAVDRDDGFVGGQWYRVTGDAGDTLLMSAPSPDSCGTGLPGWFNGTHPALLYATEDASLCFAMEHDDCVISLGFEVSRCDGFFVYRLPDVPSCNMGYCTQ